jgi:hypothetical protein
MSPVGCFRASSALSFSIGFGSSSACASKTRLSILAIAGLDGFDPADCTFLTDRSGLHIERLKVQAMRNAEFAFDRLRTCDHSLTVLDRGRHRLFAEHMFAGLERPYRIFGVHGIRRPIDLAPRVGQCDRQARRQHRH